MIPSGENALVERLQAGEDFCDGQIDVLPQQGSFRMAEMNRPPLRRLKANGNSDNLLRKTRSRVTLSAMISPAFRIGQTMSAPFRGGSRQGERAKNLLLLHAP